MMKTKKRAKAKTAVPAALSAYLSEIGSRGGAVGGDAKKRGSKAHYRELQLKAAATRKANNAAKKAAEEKAGKLTKV